MRRVIARVAIGSVLASGSLARAAALPTAITVERAPGAEGCPDEAGLSRVIDDVLRSERRTDAGAELRALVRFSREDGVYRATLLLTGKRAGERTLTDTGATCAALGRAAGITLALLLDPLLDEPAPVATVAPPAPPPPARATSGTLAASAGAALGLVGPPSLVTGLAFTLEVRRHALVALEAQWIAPRDTTFDAGEVQVGLVAARLDACGALDGPRSTRLAACATGAAGRLRGEGHGYALENGAATLPWLAAGGALEGALALGRSWRIALAAHVLAPTHPSTFSVANRGIAYRSSPVSATMELSFGAALW